MNARGRTGREEIKKGRGGQPKQEEGREPLESCGVLLS